MSICSYLTKLLEQWPITSSCFGACSSTWGHLSVWKVITYLRRKKFIFFLSIDGTECRLQQLSLKIKKSWLKKALTGRGFLLVRQCRLMIALHLCVSPCFCFLFNDFLLFLDLFEVVYLVINHLKQQQQSWIFLCHVFCYLTEFDQTYF